MCDFAGGYVQAGRWLARGGVRSYQLRARFEFGRYGFPIGNGPAFDRGQAGAVVLSVDCS
jgi:hypothetical protein